MEVQSHRHRHFIALPAFLLLCGMSLANANTPVFSALSSSSWQQASLLSEEGLLGAKGMKTVQIGDVHATFLDGTVYITKNDSTVTIAAISSPVFVEYNDERMVVPIGMQWTFSGTMAPLKDGFSSWIDDRTPTPLPQHFLEQQIQESGALKDDAQSVLPEPRQRLVSDTHFDDTFLLPASRSIAQQQRLEDILGYIRSVVEQGDRQSFLVASAQPDINDALHTSRGRAVLSALLSSLDSQSPMTMDILHILADNESVATVALFHPKYRDVAWSLTHTDASIEAKLMRAFVFPYSFYAPAPVSDFVFDRYGISLKDIADTVDDSTVFVEHLFDANHPLIQALQAKGYPQRAAYMRRTLIDVIESIETQTDTMKKDLAQLQIGDMIDVSPLPVHEASVEPKEEHAVQQADSASLSPADVESMTYAMLQDAGALFTVETNIVAFEANTARVTGVYFSGSTEDRHATFTLNVVTGIVSDIEVNGQSDYPYNPSFAAFVRWISL